MKIKWCRELNPELFDGIVSEYVEMRKVSARAAGAVICRDIGMLLASGVIERALSLSLYPESVTGFHKPLLPQKTLV